MRSVIVIGAGIGGITAAIHLAGHGIKVTVLEKNSHPGGRCDRFSRNGHHFDTGPTLLVMPLLYEAEFAALGVEVTLRELLDLQRVDPTYHLVFDDGSQLALDLGHEIHAGAVGILSAWQLSWSSALYGRRSPSLPSEHGEAGQSQFP